MTTLGKYHLGDLLHAGPTASIYRATDTLLERSVALKILNPHLLSDHEQRERFLRDARVCARLRHDHIVTIHEMGESAGHVYIASELLEGVDWFRALRASSQPPPLQRLEAMAQICEGLAHAHSKKVVHRGIKPSNLFLTSARKAVILDFGLAHIPESTLTRTGQVIGMDTSYMAPEQLAGEPCTAQSDIFSAAMVFFEFLTGIHPFRDRQIAARILHGEPERLAAVAPEHPAALTPVFVKALARRPEHRYASADTLAHDIRQAARLQRRMVIVLVHDIVGSTQVLSGVPDAEDAIRDWFSQGDRIARAHGAAGTKLTGDAMLAIWTTDDPAAVFRAATELVTSSRFPSGAGIAGGIAQIETTPAGVVTDALGDTVHLAFRAEKSTRDAGHRIAVTQAVFDRLEAAAPAGAFAPRAVPIRGYAEPVTLFYTDPEHPTRAQRGNRRMDVG